MYRHLENKMCKELEALEEKYRTGADMSEGDLRRIDLLVHSLKSIATYRAMKEAEERQSGMNMPHEYNRGYNRDMSGHVTYAPYYEERRW